MLEWVLRPMTRPGVRVTIPIEDQVMKKTPNEKLRKHGLAASLDAKVHLHREIDIHSTPSRERLKTLLSFVSDHQAYVWTTDRGRSRLIKH